jgi:hypothetical protein
VSAVTDMDGPIEREPYPERLAGHVVTPGANPRVHGYDVEGDLARHYRFTDGVLLALTGELPSEATGRAFEIVLHFLSPVSVAEAPAHAAVVARICGAHSAAIAGTGAVALAERARHVLAEHRDLIAWLDDPKSAPGPSRYNSSSPGEHASVERLRAALDAASVRLDIVRQGLSRTATLLGALHACGLRREDQMVTAMVLASLASVASEAHSHAMIALRSYPMRLPPFQYEPGR